MSNHTPGPWTFETELHSCDTTWGIWSNDDDEEVICQNVQDIQTAALIAAAPDLLAALENTLEDFIAIGGEDSERSGVVIEARLAIAKAKGGAA